MATLGDHALSKAKKEIADLEDEAKHLQEIIKDLVDRLKQIRELSTVGVIFGSNAYFLIRDKLTKL